MNFNDDEPLASGDAPAGEVPISFIAGKTKLTVLNKPDAPLEETKYKAMLELTGAGLGKDRSGVDLVMVLDVSLSMKAEGKVDKMKTAMQFVVKKLSPSDRISIVEFSDNSKRLCPLRQVTDDSRKDIEGIVNSLTPHGNTNIAAGLQTALDVLNGRKVSEGRVAAIMLMSDGEQNRGDATKISLGNVPVHTFGFGAGHDPTVLKAIADKAVGGTFSDVGDLKNLSVAFAQCLGGLLSVVVQDLKLTIKQVESTFENVNAGNYPKTDITAGSVTVTFGQLYEKEIRKVTVDLLLPAVPSRQTRDILQVNYSYSANGRAFRAPPVFASVTRSGTASAEELEEIVMEGTRNDAAKGVTGARMDADANKLENARDKLTDVQSMLDDVAGDEPKPLIEMLQTEIQQMLKFMRDEKIYQQKGRPYVLSFETSHNSQRAAARTYAENQKVYGATPIMEKLSEQAKEYDEDPTKPVPTVEEDIKEEMAKDPLGPIAGALALYIQTAIQSLKSIQDILNQASA